MKLIKNPCKEGNCLVKMTCQLLKEYPWTRKEKCPKYSTYIKRTNIVNKAIDFVLNLVFIAVGAILIGGVIVTFGLGLIEVWKYAVKLFEYLMT